MTSLPIKEMTDQKYLDAIVNAAKEMYTGKLVRILDLATGPNGFN